MQNAYETNTLRYDRNRCTGCGMCAIVCPHGVFELVGDTAELRHYGRCMECGACSLNCPAGAIEVESGVGCASALMRASLTGRGDEDACCGPRDEDASCGQRDGDACCGPRDEDASCGRRGGGGTGCC